MSSIRLSISAAIGFLLFVLPQCKKDKFNPSLPPITSIGANTFGCKIDGKVFVPRDGRGKPGLFVQYEYLGTGVGGGWFLNIPAIDWASSALTAVNIATDSLLVTEGISYQIGRKKGMVSAFCMRGINSSSADTYNKLDTDTGSLYIQRFDQVNHIISGQFSFSATDINGQKVTITDGRFDIQY